MSMRVCSAISIVLPVLGLGACPLSARADDAYLCGPDKIVYVAVDDLELKKRTDPCIAAYFGLKVEEPVASAPAAAAAPSPARGVKAPPIVRAELKPLTDSEFPSRAARPLEQQALLLPPRATPGTDFRNVKILNAASPGDGWFHHTR